MQALGSGAMARRVLLRRVEQLDALDKQLRLLLPSNLAAHVQLANIDGDTLVYLADASTWSTKLRMHSHALLDAARSLGLNSTHLRVKIKPLPTLPERYQDTPAAPVCAKTRQQLQAIRKILPQKTETTPDSGVRRLRYF